MATTQDPGFIAHAHGFLSAATNLLLGNFLPRMKTPYKDMTGKNVIITGANSGIGFVMAQQIADMGANVYMACRSRERGTKALNEIRAANKDANVTLLKLDTSSLESCRQFARQWIESGRTIDVLVHNAGIANPNRPSPHGSFTADGFEQVYQNNFLGSFLLTRLLEEKFNETTRVTFNSSVGGYFAYVDSTGWSLSETKNKLEPGFHHWKRLPYTNDSSPYGQSKLMQVMFARCLKQRYKKPVGSSPMIVEDTDRRIVTAFAPGYTKSNILQNVQRSWADLPFALLLTAKDYLATPTEQGAATGILVCVEDPDILGEHLFFDRMKGITNPAERYDQEVLDRLWIRWSADAGLDP